MLSSIRKKITCEDCGTQTARNIIVRHKKRCSAGSLTCPSCTKFSTKSRAEMKYHTAKKHSKATARFVYKSKICDKDFDSFYSLREYKRDVHGAQRGSGVQNVVLHT